MRDRKILEGACRAYVMPVSFPEVPSRRAQVERCCRAWLQLLCSRQTTVPRSLPEAELIFK